MAIPILVVDAFTSKAFSGNQAGVCLVPAGEWPAAHWMQAVAAEMRHAETAFVKPQGEAFGLRWFTPGKEVPLCGHATLASAQVLWDRNAVAAGAPVLFDTLSGRLTCTRSSAGVTMDFPSDPPLPGAAPAGLFAALGCKAVPVFEGRALGNLLLAFPDEATIRALAPDFAALRRVSDTLAFIATAPAADGDGYVCRYFAPAWGIDEDPATGSIQCTLGPYWAGRLGKADVRCRQLSRRGAEMRVRPQGARTFVTGTGVKILEGQLLATPTT
jgi:PhzF family phenazine biosynthesis protein